MHSAILEQRQPLLALCRRYEVARLDIFGSGARGHDFDPLSSDADFLVEFSPGARADHFLDLKEAFESILRRRVDLVDRRAIERSRNYIRRHQILSEAQLFYVA